MDKYLENLAEIFDKSRLEQVVLPPAKCRPPEPVRLVFEMPEWYGETHATLSGELG